MRFTLIGILLATFLLAIPVMATDINVETKILSDTSARSTITVLVDESSPNEIVIPIFYSAENLITDANFHVVCKQEKAAYGTDVVCDISDLDRSSGAFKVEFETKDLIQKVGESRLFKQQVVAPIDASKMSFKVVLPDGTGLVGENAYLPKDGSNATDGKRIFVSWTKENVKKGDIFSTQATYQYFFNDLGLLGIGIPLIVILGIGAYFFLRQQPKPEAINPINYILPVLKEDEKLIVEKIINAGGSIHQKHIVKESGYSKAKISKVLKSLEDRGMVRLERIGRSNRIYLQSKMENKKENSLGNNQKPQNALDSLESTMGNNSDEL